LISGWVYVSISVSKRDRETETPRHLTKRLAKKLRRTETRKGKRNGEV